ncbi:MAG: hypothetical protein D6814_15970 [Calditrichaeota bacterium]|nr:MAG: hypothetical protein D6814_15970 [Calditrichota bacterium]
MGMMIVMIMMLPVFMCVMLAFMSMSRVVSMRVFHFVGCMLMLWHTFALHLSIFYLCGGSKIISRKNIARDSISGDCCTRDQNLL